MAGHWASIWAYLAGYLRSQFSTPKEQSSNNPSPKIHPSRDLSVKRLKLSKTDGGDEDRLSDLPDDLLIHILVLVDDTLAAARTSILASRWRRLWAFLPVLKFAFVEHHRIGAALAAHEASDLMLLLAVTNDASPESLSAWLPIAARLLSGVMRLKVVGLEAWGKRGGAIDLPCFEKATFIKLKLGFHGLALPPSGVFARLKDLKLIDIELHGQSGLDDLLSSQRCPSLRALHVDHVLGLDNINIHLECLLYLELRNLLELEQLNVMAPALKSLAVNYCFTDALSVANISAPQLASLIWMTYNPSYFQLDKAMHLESLGIQLCLFDGEENFERNHYRMKLLRRFEHVHTLCLQIDYPSDICTGPYLIEHMPRLPDITTLELVVEACGHSFGASLFDVLKRCTGVKELVLDFEDQEQTPCPSGCICDHPPNWRTEELGLNCLEKIVIEGMMGTEHDVALVQQLFHWATLLKRMEIIFDESLSESKAKELRRLFGSFSRPDICLDMT